MLESWEQSLLVDILKNPERYRDQVCNDWDFPSWMTKEQEDEMILKCAYANDGGAEIHDDFGTEEAYLRCRRLIMNFEVPFYIYTRLEEEGILNKDVIQEYDG